MTQACTHQHQRRIAVGKSPDHTGTAADFPIEAFNGIVGTDPGPMLGGESVARALRHSKTMIKLNTYTDIKAIVLQEEYCRYMEPFIKEVTNFGPKKTEGEAKDKEPSEPQPFDFSDQCEFIYDIYEWYMGSIGKHPKSAF